MLYAMLCYNEEQFLWSWTKEDEDAVMGALERVRETLAARASSVPPCG